MGTRQLVMTPEVGENSLIPFHRLRYLVVTECEPRTLPKAGVPRESTFDAWTTTLLPIIAYAGGELTVADFLRGLCYDKSV